MIVKKWFFKIHFWVAQNILILTKKNEEEMSEMEILNSIKNLDNKAKIFLIEKIFQSLDDQATHDYINKNALEAENRIDDYDSQKLKAYEIEEVLKKYK